MELSLKGNRSRLSDFSCRNTKKNLFNFYHIFNTNPTCRKPVVYFANTKYQRVHSDGTEFFCADGRMDENDMA
jgi:hypothetical protein